MTTATNIDVVSTINATASNGQSSEATRELTADELAQVSGGLHISRSLDKASVKTFKTV
jgi:bacteriocin-like protein